MHSAATLNRVGGRLCLDFVNTAAWRRIAIANEHLKSFGAVIDWGRAGSMLDKSHEAALRVQLHALPRRAATALGEVLRFRATLRQLIDPTIRRELSDRRRSQLIEDLHHTLQGAFQRTHLAAAADGRLALTGEANLTDWLIAPVALSAAALLTSTDLTAVRACDGDGCGWLFLDQSPGGRRRRWCAMEPCGNRIKASRHYQRHRARQALRQQRGDVP